MSLAKSDVIKTTKKTLNNTYNDGHYFVTLAEIKFHLPLSGHAVAPFNLAVDSSTETTSNNNFFPLVKWDTVWRLPPKCQHFSFQRVHRFKHKCFYFEVKVNASSSVRGIFEQEGIVAV